MATGANQVPHDPNVTYLKAAQLYDDGSRNSKYLDEVRKEDEGVSPFQDGIKHVEIYPRIIGHILQVHFISQEFFIYAS